MFDSQWLAIFLLFAAISYWAFGMELFRRARSSLRGSIALKMRGGIIDFAEYGAIFFVLVGTFLWLWFTYKWYTAILLFILMQIAASILSAISMGLIIRRQPELLFELGGSYTIFIGWILADALVLSAWLVFWPMR